MANQEQLEIVRQGMAAWNAWREEHPGIQSDRRRVNLQRTALHGANLEGPPSKRPTSLGPPSNGLSSQGPPSLRPTFRGPCLKRLTSTGLTFETQS